MTTKRRMRRRMQYLKLFIDRYVELGRPPVLRELAGDARVPGNSMSGIRFMLEKLVDGGYLTKKDGRYSPVGIEKVVENYLKGGGYASTIKDLQLAPMDEDPARDAKAQELEVSPE